MNNVNVALGIVEGKVIAKWPDAITEIEFDPKNAWLVGMAMCKAAIEAHRGSKDKGDVSFIAGELADARVKITDAQRDALIAKVATILKTFDNQGKSPGLKAMHVVDAVLTETAK